MKYRGIAFETLKFIVKAPYELVRNAVLELLAWSQHPISEEDGLTTISFPKSEKARAYKEKTRRLLTPRVGIRRSLETFIASVEMARNCIADLRRDHEEDEISTQARLYLKSDLGRMRYSTVGGKELVEMTVEDRRRIVWNAIRDFININKKFPHLIDGSPSEVILMYHDAFESPFDPELKLKAEINQDTELLELLDLAEHL